MLASTAGRFAILVSALFGVLNGAVLHDAVAADVNVPRFLTGRQPAADDGILPTTGRHRKRRLETDLPGLGWSSPIVGGQRVFLTTCVNTGQAGEPRKGLYFEDVDANKYPPTRANTCGKYLPRP